MLQNSLKVRRWGLMHIGSPKNIPLYGVKPDDIVLVSTTSGMRMEIKVTNVRSERIKGRISNVHGIENEEFYRGAEIKLLEKNVECVYRGCLS